MNSRELNSEKIQIVLEGYIILDIILFFAGLASF